MAARSDAVYVNWLPVTIDRTERLESTMILYCYVTVATREIV